MPEKWVWGREKNKKVVEWMRQETELLQLRGSVENIVFHSEDTGFTVLELGTEEELVTVVGEMMNIDVGEELELLGSYTNHPTYGPQFKASVCRKSLPATASAILKYLSSGAIKGVGPVLARRMVEQFGDQTLQIVEKQPERLTEVKGITPKKMEQIREEYMRIFSINIAMMFLAQHGIDPLTSIRTWKVFGPLTVDLVQENPYALCRDEIGVPFERADEMALGLSFSLEDKNRVRAGLEYVLRHNLSNGHTCLPFEKLVKASCNLLEVNSSLVEVVLEEELEEKNLVEAIVEDIRFVYLPEMYAAETYCAGKLSAMLRFGSRQTLKLDTQIALLEEQYGIHYAVEQKKSIHLALTCPVFILTGGPGTGKTTTVNAILELLEQQGEKVGLAAPTGRAAKRLSEVTGREAKTIHRLLEVDFLEPGARMHKFKHNEKNPLNLDTIILDEVSMVDMILFESLLRAVKLSTRLILIGDSDQLPAVGAGNVLKCLVDCGEVETVALNEVFRQAAQSLIVTNAHAIVRGEKPDLTVRDNDFFFLKSTDNRRTLQTVVDLSKTRLPKTYGYSSLWDIQVLSPNRVGEVGTYELNRLLQEALNPPDRAKKEFRHTYYTFREGDKVMQIKNNYDIVWKRDDGEEGAGVFNGDIGILEEIDRASQMFRVRFEDKTVSYPFDFADELELAYACTVHKSQGSEFEAVVLPLMDWHPKLYHRNLFYTAVTRAKKLLVLLGRPETVYRMAENSRKTLRYTNFGAFLSDAMRRTGQPETE